MRSHALFAHVPVFTVLLCLSARAANYSESISGDISGNRFTPTFITLDAGDNFVTGNFGASPVPNVPDLDYLNVVVPSGYETQVILQNLIPGGANSFLGISVGPIFLIASTSNDPSPLLAASHIYTYEIGTNILPAFALGNALPAGSYTFWINETDTSQAWNYAFNFQVTAVPEPASFAIISPALVCLAARRWRKRA